MNTVSFIATMNGVAFIRFDVCLNRNAYFSVVHRCRHSFSYAALVTDLS